ncbi:MAG: hypothetical protein JWM73_2003 [Solirubrobacterales bacterium]|nr:hypothetical protein [Solirubrobacterales bacterium]
MAAMAERANDLPASYRLARIGLAALTALLSVFLWTGAPLMAIWVGGQVQGGTGLTMSAVGVVIGVLAVTVTLIVLALVRVEAAYKFFSGAPVDKRRTAPWMRSLRGERPELAEKRPLTGFEKVLVGAVVAGGLAFEAWFFLLAGSPIG